VSTDHVTPSQPSTHLCVSPSRAAVLSPWCPRMGQIRTRRSSTTRPPARLAFAVRWTASPYSCGMSSSRTARSRRALRACVLRSADCAGNPDRQRCLATPLHAESDHRAAGRRFGVDPDPKRNAARGARDDASRPECDRLCVGRASGVVVCRACDEPHDAMRVAQLCLSLWKRPVGESCESARPRRKLQRDAVTVPHEERELIAVKHACPAGVTPRAGHHERPDDQVPWVRERTGKVRKRRSRAIFDNAPRRSRRRSTEGGVHVPTDRRRGDTRDHHDARKRHSRKVQTRCRRCKNRLRESAGAEGLEPPAYGFGVVR
jgi:hypothetical protein